jgi:hypothetical protein
MLDYCINHAWWSRQLAGNSCDVAIMFMQILYDLWMVSVFQQIEGPGNFVQEVHDKTADKLEFIAHHSGSYKFCFKTTSLFSETVDFDVHIGHIPYYDQKLQDGNVNAC